MKASDIFGVPSPEVARALSSNNGLVVHQSYSHGIEIGGRKIAQCVASDHSTTPPTLVLKLAENVKPKEVKKMELFKGFKLVLV